MSVYNITLPARAVVIRLKELTQMFQEDPVTFRIMKGEILMYLNPMGSFSLQEECQSLIGRINDLTHEWAVEDMHSVTFLFLKTYVVGCLTVAGVGVKRVAIGLCEQVASLIDQENFLDSEIISIGELLKGVPGGGAQRFL